MAEFGTSLAPSNDFPAVELARSLFEKLVFAVQVFVDDFAVVEDGLDFLRGWFWTERQRIQRSAP